MKRFLITVAVVVLLIPAFLVSCGEKDSESPEDLAYKDLIGRWAGLKKSDENGVKIVETLILIFWKEDEYLWYRWSYSVTKDAVQDHNLDFEEQGKFTVAENEITLMPEGGNTKILTYSLLNADPLYDLSIIDEDGVEWKFEYFHRD